MTISKTHDVVVTRSLPTMSRYLRNLFTYIIFLCSYFFGWMLFITIFFFFFQAEDGIRDHCVTGVQTCALPICSCSKRTLGISHVTLWSNTICKNTMERLMVPFLVTRHIYVSMNMNRVMLTVKEIGRASCRERV